MTTVSIKISNESDTFKLGEVLAKYAAKGDVFALHGNLGAGKTVLAQGFIKTKCGEDTVVTSPTYTLVQIYDDSSSALEVWHFDLYRLEAQEDIWETGIEDAFAHGISLIEWPSRMEGYLPRDIINVSILLNSNNENHRTVEITTTSEKWQDKLPEIERAFS